MAQIRVLLPELLAQHRLNRKQLAEGSGMRYATINDMYTGKRRPSLDTLEAVMAGLERMIGQAVELGDLLGVVHAPALDAAHLKTFHLRPCGTQPKISTLRVTLAYLDTSALAKLYVNASGQQQVMDLIEEADKMVTSVIAYPEARADFEENWREVMA